MFAKLFLVVSLATLVVSFAKEENELINTALNSGTNLLREFSKLVSDDSDKYSVDLNSVYKKYEFASKADQAKNYAQIQYKKLAELLNDYIKKVDIESEDQMKKSIDVIKKEDNVLGEKLMKFYDKQCDLDRISEDIVKYVTDVEKVSNLLEKTKSALSPLEHKTADAIKKVETFVIEHLPKKGRGKK